IYAYRLRILLGPPASAKSGLHLNSLDTVSGLDYKLLMAFTNADRQAGRSAMEKVMDFSPLKRALRKFTAGRPTKQPVDTPLGAVVLAVEQRDRLARLLKEEGVEAHI